MQTKKNLITKVINNEIINIQDDIVIEEPLEIFINSKSQYFCMRLPGDDIALAVGLCFIDGIIDSYADIKNIHYNPKENSNRLELELLNIKKDLKNTEQRIIKSSTGGIKGKDIADFFESKINKIEVTDHIIGSEIFNLQKDFLNKQSVFYSTGGTHAVSIYNHRGKSLAFAEDVGRHNAMDKCIGKILISDQMQEAFIAILSSRLSYEMVSKACQLGLQIAAGTSAPTSLAIEIAKQCNLTLIGFLRDPKFNIYSCPERIINK
ncbi:MAG: formate dehydrogenase family accessory protein FdhD [Candidatus Melainabacteria bacterium RIFOXYA12_FULL_32_12]|nr:MAG: formate dehydrogenase family accessory protein FdhD [Candidatus Melainabacteria bacterium RIFOXYA12_FULL_32_12]